MTVLADQDFVEESCAKSSLTDVRRWSVQDALARYRQLAGDPSLVHMVVGEVLGEQEVLQTVAHWLDGYGQDALRLALLFAAPPGQSFEWTGRSVRSASGWLERFRDRVSAYARERSPERVDEAAPGFERDMDAAVLAASEYYRRGRIDRAIWTTLAGYTMACKRGDAHGSGRAGMGRVFDMTLRLLMPVTPSMVESVWPLLSGDRITWPGRQAETEEPVLAVAVDGRVRGRFRASRGTSEITAYRKAQTLENVQRHLAGRRPHKVIYVPDRLINLVVT